MEDLSEKKARLNQSIKGLEGLSNNFSSILLKELQYSYKAIDFLEKKDKEGFAKLIRGRYQGGLSNWIFNNQIIIDYFIENYGTGGGYFGQDKFRNEKIDKYLESKLISNGLNDFEIISFLISKIARWEFEEYNYNEESAQDIERDENYEGPKFQGTNQEKKDLIDNRIDYICKEIKELI